MMSVQMANHWEAIQARLRETLDPRVYRLWFEPLSLLPSDDKAVLRLAAPNEQLVEGVRSFLRKDFTEALTAVGLDDLTVRFAIRNALAHAEPWQGGKVTFDSFVVGDTNAQAFDVAMAVAKGIATTFPVLIAGGTGVGKTHLLTAVGGLASGSGKRVVYTTAPDLVNYLVPAIRTSRQGECYGFFRQVDLLLLDDIQFLSKKTQTQHTFCSILDILNQNGSRILITANRAPSELDGFIERLQDRLHAGFVCTVFPPNQKTKEAQIISIARQRGYEMPADVVSCIARYAGSSTREIEGVLTQIAVTAEFEKHPVSVEIAEDVFQKIYSVDTTPLAPERVFEAVASNLDIPVAKLKKGSQRKADAHARHLVMFLLRELTELSYPEIAKLFGMNHTSVQHGVKKIDGQREGDPSLHRMLECLITELGTNRSATRKNR